MDDYEDPCEHSDWAVRISCHADLTSAECRDGAMFSAYCCGRPACKGRTMALVKARTGFDPVTVKRTPNGAPAPAQGVLP